MCNYTHSIFIQLSIAIYCVLIVVATVLILRRIFGFITANACIEQTFLKLNPSFACKRSFIFFNKDARFLNVNKISCVWDIHSIFFLFERIFYGIKYEI